MGREKERLDDRSETGQEFESTQVARRRTAAPQAMRQGGQSKKGEGKRDRERERERERDVEVRVERQGDENPSSRSILAIPLWRTVNQRRTVRRSQS